MTIHKPDSDFPDITYCLSYHPKGNESARHTALPSMGDGMPCWIVELMEEGNPSEGTDIMWYCWEHEGGYATPNAEELKRWSNLEAALQECFLALLRYSGLAYDGDPPLDTLDDELDEYGPDDKPETKH